MAYNPADTGATAHRQAGNTHNTRLNDSGGKAPKPFFEADAQGGEVTDLGVESYTPGSLLKRAGEIATGLAWRAAQGEEGLEPQTA